MITGDFNHLDPRQLCQRFGLRKVVKDPTRGNNILDQVLTNMSYLYGDAQHLPPLGRSDHQCRIVYKPLNCRAEKKATKLPTKRTVRNLKADNIRALGLKLDTEDWKTVYEAVDDKVGFFNSIIRLITETLDTCAPMRNVRMHTNDKEWITPYIKDQIRARQRAYLRGDRAGYQAIRAKVMDLIRNAKRWFYETKASNLRYSNSSKWYKSIFSLCGAQNQQKNITAPTKEQLQNVADQLLQAFSAPWENCEPSAYSVSNALLDRLDDRPSDCP